MSDTVYVNEKVSVAALNGFYAQNNEKGRAIHTLQIYKDNERLVRIASEPYSCTDKRQVYSLSKSFCSTAVGIAIGEGLFGLDDRIVDLFPDGVPHVISEHLAEMKVRHVMSMNSGLGSDSFGRCYCDESPAKGFMKAVPEFEPGSHFFYDSGASTVMSELVQKYTGMTVLDYLDKKVFGYLDISGLSWQSTPAGINEGGVGIHVDSDDITKLGLLYLNHGMWNGRQVIPAEWTELVHQPHSDNSMNGTPDWTSGYGFFFWINERDGYRGAGSHGQFCLIFPKRNMVIAVQAEAINMKGELNTLYDLAEKLLDKSGDGDTVLETQKFTPYSSEERVLTNDGVRYRAEYNPMGITQFYTATESGGDSVRFVFSDGSVQSVIRAGIGRWISGNEWTAPAMMPKLRPRLYITTRERLCGAASCRIVNGEPEIAVRLTNSPHTLFYKFSYGDDGRCNVAINTSINPGLPAEACRLTGTETL